MLSAGRGFAQSQADHNFEISKNLDIFNSAYRELELYYVDSLNAKKNIETALVYMLNQFDPYTEYYADDNLSELKQITTGKYGGIGALIQYRPSLKRCVVAEPYAHTPAAEAGLHAGDVLLSIDGRDYGDCDGTNTAAYSNEVSGSLRGDLGTTFELRVRRHGFAEPLAFRITRRTISLPSVQLDTVLQDSVGYICLSSYNENTAHELKLALARVKQLGAKRLILDLRGNPGGLLDQAVKVVGMFVPRGKEVVRLKGKIKRENTVYHTEDAPLDTQIPLVVLVDFNTASSAEITSGALQDYDRAVIVGRNTYGKGLVQEARQLPYGAILKLTTSKYYIPSGRCIQAYRYQNGMPVHLSDSVSAEFHTAAGRSVRDGGGIRPDVEVKLDSLPLLISYLEVSDALMDFCSDYQLHHPTIASPDTFSLSAEEYCEFRQFLKDHGFTYDSQSRTALQTLRRIADMEGYTEVASEAFAALEDKLSKNEDFDFTRWESDIRQVVEGALLSRYYYQRGTQVYALRADKDLSEALRLICDDARYRSILAAPAGK